MTPSDHLTTSELASRWRVHPNTLLRWRADGKGPPCIRLGQRILYPLAGVIQYEQSNRIDSNV